MATYKRLLFLVLTVLHCLTMQRMCHRVAKQKVQRNVDDLIILHMPSADDFISQNNWTQQKILSSKEGSWIQWLQDKWHYFWQISYFFCASLKIFSLIVPRFSIEELTGSCKREQNSSSRKLILSWSDFPSIIPMVRRYSIALLLLAWDLDQVSFSYTAEITGLMCVCVNKRHYLQLSHVQMFSFLAWSMRNGSKKWRGECIPEMERPLLLVHMPMDPQTTTSHSQTSLDDSCYGLFCRVILSSGQLIHPGNERPLFVVEGGETVILSSSSHSLPTSDLNS